MSEWSKPVSLRNQHLHDIAIRGRLLIIEGSEPGYAGPNPENAAMTFVELQNVSLGGFSAIDVHFAVTNLQCQLFNAAGQAIPVPPGMAWGGRGPWPPSWAAW